MPNTTISSVAVNSDFSDIAAALSASIAADGQTPITGTLKSSVSSAPQLAAATDATTGFGSVLGQANIYAGGTVIVAVTSTGVVVTGTISGTSLELQSLTLTGSGTTTSVTFTNASPTVINWPTHGFSANQPVYFTATTMPTGIISTEVYYVVGASITTNTFEISLTPGGSAIGATSTGTTVVGAVPALNNQDSSTTTNQTTNNLSVTGVLTANTTGYWQPPTGGTAARPSSPVAGWSRYNSDLELPEWFDGATWRQPILAPPIQGNFKNLSISNNSGTPNTQTTLTADAVIVSGSGNTFQVNSLNLTLNIASNWAGGGNLDTGSVAASTWYYIWIIYNPTSNLINAIYSLSSTAPTLPSGYTASARVGAVRTDGSSHFLRVTQINRRAQYIVTAATNTANMPAIITGSQGNPNTPTWVAGSVSTIVPATATLIGVTLNTAGGGAMAAPNNSYGTLGSTTNPPPIYGNNAGVGASTAIADWWVLESTNVYYASGSASNGLFCKGWEDGI